MITLIVIGLIVVVLIFVVLGSYNRLVALDQKADQAFSDIDVQLKQRNDLIPNLVETVKGYAAHEQGTLNAVTQARAAAAGATTVDQKVEADNMLTGALGRLFAVAEAYPDLKASQNMLQLTEELTSTENRVAFARQAFNDAVLAYNNRREVFPASVVAGAFNFQPAALLEIPAESREAVRAAPKVQF